MAKNDIVLLDGLLDEQAAETPSTPADEVFEMFACEQILKDQDLSLDQVESGRVGGSDATAVVMAMPVPDVRGRAS